MSTPLTDQELRQHWRECACHDSWDQCPCAEGGHPLDRECGCCGDGICGPLPTLDARIAAAVGAERDRLLGKLEALHAPFRIYDDCGHEHTDEDVAFGRAVEVPEVGYTCALEYVACRFCCAGNDGLLDWQTEDCANYHKHTLNPDDRCPTMRLVADERGGTP